MTPAPVPVPCRWPGGTIVVVAPGPSLASDDLALIAIADLPILAVNDAILDVPSAAVLYAPDAHWWQWHAADLRPRTCWKYSVRALSAVSDPAVGVLIPTDRPGLSTDPARVHLGGHGGYQAINLAVHLVGAGGTILLTGFDMQPSIAADGSIQHHARREHPDDGRPPLRYDRWLSVYAGAYDACRTRSIRLLNASRRTAITALPRVDLAAALAGDLPA